MDKKKEAAALLRLIEYGRGEALLLGMPGVASALRVAAVELTREAGADVASSVLVPAENDSESDPPAQEHSQTRQI